MEDSDCSPTPEAGGGGSVDRLHTTKNGRAGSPGDDIPARSPSPRYRRYSDSTPTRSPSPLQLADGYDGLENTSSRKTKSVSFHSHTNWKSDRKIQSGECYECVCVCVVMNDRVGVERRKGERKGKEKMCLGWKEKGGMRRERKSEKRKGRERIGCILDEKRRKE